MHVYFHKFLAGTAAAFVAQGYPAKIFRGKMLQRIGARVNLNKKEIDQQCVYAVLSRLMHGYFAIDMLVKVEETRDKPTIGKTPELATPNRLRLVVDNTRSDDA